MYVDGIETDRAAVDDLCLIKRLNISQPVSLNDGNVRFDQNLSANYKGIFLKGIPRSSHLGRYWFQIRGSLIKLANQGRHNYDTKDPLGILYALDDLIVTLGLDAFKTLINGLELSTTIPIKNPQQVCSSIVSYLNHPPTNKTIPKNGVLLPYTEIEARQHKLKLYSPSPDRLRFEVKIDKMQYLGKNAPKTFADLIQPQYAELLATKLLVAFDKILWKYSDINVDSLPPIDYDLYLRGRVHEYWQVRKQDCIDNKSFKRVEQQRSREKKRYKEIVNQYWLDEPPAELARRIRQQQQCYGEMIQSQLYRHTTTICLERWHFVANNPDFISIPPSLTLPPLSEIYPLYFGRFPTSLSPD